MGMSSRPWVSVVIPLYRAEKTISDTIASVTSQHVGGVEIICVDDDSPDSSGELVTALASSHPMISLVSNAENLGPGATRNRGIEKDLFPGPKFPFYYGILKPWRTENLFG